MACYILRQYEWKFRGFAAGVCEFESGRSALKEHKFQIGHTVYFTSRPIGHMATNGSYRVVKLLPSDGDDYQYRIKSTEEAFERVAKESQLDRAR
jgi:hypothetical protein